MFLTNTFKHNTSHYLKTFKRTLVSTCRLLNPVDASAKPASSSSPSSIPPPGSAAYVEGYWGSSNLTPILTKSPLPLVTQSNNSDAIPHLNAGVRTKGSSKISKQMRQHQFRIPAQISDRSTPGRNHILLHLDRFEVEELARIKSRAFPNTVMDIHVDGKTYRVIPEVVQRHAVTRDIISMSFFHYLEGHKIKMKVPILYKGIEECEGVKKGGVMVVSRDNLTCYWRGGTNIPTHITVDLTSLPIGEVLRSSHISLPSGLRLHAPQTPIVLVTIVGQSSKSREDEGATAETGATAAAAATPAAGGAQQALDKAAIEKQKKEEADFLSSKAQKAGAGKK